MSDATNSFLRPEWTGHALVTKTYTIGLTNCGKGIWRANPHLAKNPRYRQKLANEIERFVATKLDYNLSAQDKWDLIKRKTKQVTINFARHHDTWRKPRIKVLQSERNNLLRRYRSDIECLKLLLPEVEGELSKLQQEIVEIQMLKAGRRWLEQSEKSPGNIKHIIDQRVDQRTVAMLKHPSTGEACLDMETKLNATESFYQDLYTEEPIDYDDILDGARRTPKQGSPGLDGIGYEILYLLVSHPSCRDIIHQVFNDAVRLAKFPKS
ncbi:putative PHD type zinc finger protein with BAH domain-containing protein [Mucor velutinosus]|uniref:PHD type zinc finger protein with BAH domain-containing protein n=1 Tax=Mucor velutinosus TaxID=708070 RepID=A0AAN7DIT7_9FUNG|nr:putative PHD type zinc finger protein with BAH domain-containing protein [Mucor velutinosus]